MEKAIIYASVSYIPSTQWFLLYFQFFMVIDITASKLAMSASGAECWMRSGSVQAGQDSTSTPPRQIARWFEKKRPGHIALADHHNYAPAVVYTAWNETGFFLMRAAWANSDLRIDGPTCRWCELIKLVKKIYYVVRPCVLDGAIGRIIIALVALWHFLTIAVVGARVSLWPCLLYLNARTCPFAVLLLSAYSATW